jgi:predicted adenylyl cyclase CyaB
MPKNIELKIKVDNFDSIKSKLKNLNCSFEGILNQTDVYYIASSFLLKLRKSNSEYQLIKYYRNEVDRERISEYEILKILGENPISFFNSIFKISAVVNKKRELYLYKNSRIHLDEVENLGRFLEIEAIVKTNKEEAEKEFLEIAQALGLDLSKQLKASYRDLMLSIN